MHTLVSTWQSQHFLVFMVFETWWGLGFANQEIPIYSIKENIKLCYCDLVPHKSDNSVITKEGSFAKAKDAKDCCAADTNTARWQQVVVAKMQLFLPLWVARWAAVFKLCAIMTAMPIYDLLGQKEWVDIWTHCTRDKWLSTWVSEWLCGVSEWIVSYVKQWASEGWVGV